LWSQDKGSYLGIVLNFGFIRVILMPSKHKEQPRETLEE
jgi:hypothetical protein